MRVVEKYSKKIELQFCFCSSSYTDWHIWASFFRPFRTSCCHRFQNWDLGSTWLDTYFVQDLLWGLHVSHRGCPHQPANCHDVGHVPTYSSPVGYWMEVRTCKINSQYASYVRHSSAYQFVYRLGCLDGHQMSQKHSRYLRKASAILWHGYRCIFFICFLGEPLSALTKWEQKRDSQKALTTFGSFKKMKPKERWKHLLKKSVTAPKGDSFLSFNLFYFPLRWTLWNWIHGTHILTVCSNLTIIQNVSFRM